MKKNPAAVTLAKRRMKKVTPGRRKEIARAAARARWDREPRKGRSAAPSIEQIAAERAARVPEKDWNRLPEDLIENLDHYLYGVPKQ